MASGTLKMGVTDAQAMVGAGDAGSPVALGTAQRLTQDCHDVRPLPGTDRSPGGGLVSCHRRLSCMGASLGASRAVACRAGCAPRAGRRMGPMPRRPPTERAPAGVAAPTP